MEILVLIGTQTGNTEHVATEVAESLGGPDLRFILVDLLDAWPEMLLDYRFLIVAVSTWGDGELPDNALDFYDALVQVSPELDHVSFGVIALGDHVYDPYFCAAGNRFTETLEGLGATCLCPPFEIDAGPSRRDLEQAREWAAALTVLFRQTHAKT